MPLVVVRLVSTRELDTSRFRKTEARAREAETKRHRREHRDFRLRVAVVVKTFIEQRERVKPVSSMKLGVILSPGRHWSKPPLEPVGPELVVSLVRSC